MFGPENTQVDPCPRIFPTQIFQKNNCCCFVSLFKLIFLCVYEFDFLHQILNQIFHKNTAGKSEKLPFLDPCKKNTDATQLQKLLIFLVFEDHKNFLKIVTTGLNSPIKMSTKRDFSRTFFSNPCKIFLMFWTLQKVFLVKKIQVRWSMGTECLYIYKFSFCHQVLVGKMFLCWKGLDVKISFFLKMLEKFQHENVQMSFERWFILHLISFISIATNLINFWVGKLQRKILWDFLFRFFATEIWVS